MIIWKQNFVSSILMFKQIGLPSTQSSDFVNHLNDYTLTLNWTPPTPTPPPPSGTPLRPITI